MRAQPQFEARLCGLFYLLIILCGVWAEGFVRARLVVEADPAASAMALRDHAALFRAGMVADAVMLACDVMVAVLFHRLLRGHGRGLARLALVLRLLQAATILAGVSLLVGVLPDLDAGEAQAALDRLQRHGLIYDIGLIFFAGNCVAMAVLLRRSGGVPGVIALGLGLSAGVYLCGSLVHLFMPAVLVWIEPAYLIPLLSETALALWLLVRARI